jgi:hypothetical protein
VWYWNAAVHVGLSPVSPGLPDTAFSAPIARGSFARTKLQSCILAAHEGHMSASSIDVLFPPWTMSVDHRKSRLQERAVRLLHI